MRNLHFYLSEIKQGIISDDFSHARRSFIDGSKVCRNLYEKYMLLQFGLLIIDANFSHVESGTSGYHDHNVSMLKDVIHTLKTTAAECLKSGGNLCIPLCDMLKDKNDDIFEYRKDINRWAALTRSVWGWPPTIELIPASRNLTFVASKQCLQSQSLG